jgi:hypothetical protein
MNGSGLAGPARGQVGANQPTTFEQDLINIPFALRPGLLQAAIARASGRIPISVVPTPIPIGTSTDTNSDRKPTLGEAALPHDHCLSPVVEQVHLRFTVDRQSVWNSFRNDAFEVGRTILSVCVVHSFSLRPGRIQAAIARAGSRFPSAHKMRPIRTAPTPVPMGSSSETNSDRRPTLGEAAVPHTLPFKRARITEGVHRRP